MAEPVFANVCSARGLKRISHRGRTKENTQGLLYCLVHNIGKVSRYGNLEAGGRNCSPPRATRKRAVISFCEGVFLQTR